MSDLKKELIKLGSTNPELRHHIRPVLDKIAGSGSITLFNGYKLRYGRPLTTKDVEAIEDSKFDTGEGGVGVEGGDESVVFVFDDDYGDLTIKFDSYPDRLPSGTKMLVDGSSVGVLLGGDTSDMLFYAFSGPKKGCFVSRKTKEVVYALPGSAFSKNSDY